MQAEWIDWETMDEFISITIFLHMWSGEEEEQDENNKFRENWKIIEDNMWGRGIESYMAMQEDINSQLSNQWISEVQSLARRTKDGRPEDDNVDLKGNEVMPDWLNM